MALKTGVEPGGISKSGPEFSVHGVGLVDEEGGELRNVDCQGNGRCPNGVMVQISTCCLCCFHDLLSLLLYQEICIIRHNNGHLSGRYM